MHSDTQVRSTGTPKGRGVFALRSFAAGELVEEAHVILGKLGGLADALKDYHFNWTALIGQTGKSLYQVAIALGNGSLYNSANPANMRYEADPARLSIRFIAVRDIAAGEELTINYSAEGGGSASPKDDWFEKRKLTQL
jgi:hypothetical protein